MTLRVHLHPPFSGEDQGDGGIRRVVEAQVKYLPEFDIELTDPDQADVIACHATAPETYFTLYPEKIFVAHSHGVYWSEYDWADWAIKANKDCLEFIRRADAVTAPSEWVAQALRRHTMRDVVAIGHGIDIDEWEPTSENLGYVLWNKTRPDPVCDPGPVEELAKLMPQTQFVTTFGTPSENIKVSGALSYPEAKEVLRRAGVYLCTTRETFGIGTLEAMAAGVPVVGWVWGGQREIIEHEVTGWLCPPGDFKGLQEGIEWALANREQIAGRARSLVEKHYCWRDAVRKYADLYHLLNARNQEPRPKVSVVVTAYNLEQYLPDCLRSVQSQDFQDWECVVVDDASPDNCGAIADAFALEDPRFHVVHNKENLYQAGARNAGITASKGKYILPLDADDMLPTAALGVLSKVLDRDRTIHIVYGNVEFLDPDGKRWHSGWPMPFRFDWQMMQHNLMPYSSMFRREAWEVTRGYRTRCRTGDDPDFWCRISSYGFRPAMVTTADTLIYRNREDSMTHVVPPTDWVSWFPWRDGAELAPAGAVTQEQLPISSLEPVRVAIIIPVGPGHEKYVMDAVDSVDAQTFRNWECIVVNDTGGALPSLPSWAKIVNIRGAPVGVAGARNAGLYESTAPLFVPLDADDYLEPQALARMLEVWDQVGGVVYSDWWEQWADGTTQQFSPQDYDAKRLVSNGCIHAVTALYPRSAWEAVGGFDNEILAWEDWDFQLSLADIGVCGSRIPEPLFVYRKDLGRRRDQNHADFEVSKESIKAKWGALWEPIGGKELMACGSCPGGGGKVISPRSLPARSAYRQEPPVGEDVVVVEYIGQKQGAMVYIGPISRTAYRFDGSQEGRLKYILRRDTEFFAERPIDFRVLGEPNGQKPIESEVEEKPQPVLAAPGPPNR